MFCEAATFAGWKLAIGINLLLESFEELLACGPGSSAAVVGAAP
jgi:hypothetical protein